MVPGYSEQHEASLLALRNAGSRIVLKGIPASEGVAIGQTCVIRTEAAEIHRSLPLDQVESEIERFSDAIEEASCDLLRAAEIARRESATVSSIIESYLLILRDPIITTEINSRIATGNTAEAAVTDEYEARKKQLFAARDVFLRERAMDLEHVKDKLLASLRRVNHVLEHAADSVVVSGSLTPDALIFYKQSNVLAFVTEVGGINSHASIMARDLGIPAVIGVRNAAVAAVAGTTIIVDGYSGFVIVNPDEAALHHYRQKQEHALQYRTALGKLAIRPTTTSDGHFLRLSANVETLDNVDLAAMNGADGVGLVRTEYMLIRSNSYPSEDEQSEWYSDIAQRAFPKTVTFRAYDVGSDKYREGIPHAESNPALGLRGIRFLLYRPDIFRGQVRAVLRASSHRNVRFMIPMISILEEWLQARVLIDNCINELSSEGYDIDPAMPLGVMIETPSAALLADEFAARCDFLSIGTNDLAQYALATDRDNELVADIFDALHPSVIRMVKHVVDAAHRHERPVSICGELAGHAEATELLVGLGVNELSVSPNLMLEVKKRILNTNYINCRIHIDRLMSCSTTSEVRSLLELIHAEQEFNGRGDE